VKGGGEIGSSFKFNPYGSGPDFEKRGFGSTVQLPRKNDAKVF